MNTAMVGSRPTESSLTNSGASRKPSQAEAEAAVRTLIEWAGDEYPCLEVIEPMLDLYRRFTAERWVQADDNLMQVVDQGASSRTRQEVAFNA